MRILKKYLVCFEQEMRKFYYTCKRNPDLEKIPTPVIKAGYKLITRAQKVFLTQELVEVEILNARLSLIKRPYDMCFEFEQYLSKMSTLIKEINGFINTTNSIDNRSRPSRS